MTIKNIFKAVGIITIAIITTCFTHWVLGTMIAIILYFANIVFYNND